MAAAPRPPHLSNALSELIALRGWARNRGDAQLEVIWRDIAGPIVASQTKVQKINRGVMHVNVSNSPLLSELAMFHKSALLEALREKHPNLNVNDLKFRLQTISKGSIEN
jgi:predicted nucleic acid-binding Zn ribbon protein